MKMTINQEVNNKIKSSLSPVFKCPTRQEIEATGKGKVSGDYKSTQLVPFDAVDEVKKTNYITFSLSDLTQIKWVSDFPLASELEATASYMDTEYRTQKKSFYLLKGSQHGSGSVNYSIEMIANVRITPHEDSFYYYSTIVDNTPV